MIINIWPFKQNIEQRHKKNSFGQLKWSNQVHRCTIGLNGIGLNKIEGDGKTPIGSFPLQKVFYRPDRISKPLTSLPTQPILPNLGWCDDPKDKDYNTLVRIPHLAHHERLWRRDNLYDLIIEIGFNTNPVIPNYGSAIFIHVAQPQYKPTKGCIGIALDVILRLLRRCDKNTLVRIKLKPPWN